MYRRRALSAVGGSVATLSLAGCLGDDDDGSSQGTNTEEETENEEETDTDTDDGNAETESEEETTGQTVDESAELIATADETLDEAVDEFEAALDDTDDPLGERSNAIETRPIEARIDDAETNLAAARDGATDDQLETIAALEDVVEFLRDFVAVFSAFGDAMDEFEVWEQYLDQERWEDAVRVAERAESYNDDAMDSMTVARSTFDDIETDALKDVDEIDRVELEVTLEELEDMLTVLDVFFTGGRQFAEAMIPFDDAITALEAERFQTAASEFSAADAAFTKAYHTFTDAEDDAPAEFRSDLIDMSCELDALSDAAAYYALGASEYADGNYSRGDEYFADGEAAAERCNRSDVAL
ncbi:hypothetical protein [Natronorubrum thiooxidans]|uniref:Uncharacterized protein n=1 Tax=Natronorubrum thiooxidans TaxID=308853 RepID=A0A1N7C4R5_9EURY|nr:hypothetical protein [Natronorubrum thiooxidans]SIR58547.1 hypothetical protein SAMN05421752_101117 [Natronorubrum thiooxidans]